jgi:uncharacterized membrane protein YeaQ/YmgE (transglycosylase-associated protein family)
VLGTILSIIASGFLVGGLARWAIPGPDPMPFWLTVVFGLVGSMIGGGIAVAALGATQDHVSESDYFTISTASILATVVLLLLYRRFYQKRPLSGPEAFKPPTRGIGLRRHGPPFGGYRPRPLNKQQLLAKIDELHDAGLLTDEEYVERRREVLRQG